MERKIEEISKTRKKVTVTVDGDLWKQEQDKAFKKAAGKVTVKGFRPGKAPEAMLREHVRAEDVYSEAVDKIVPAAFRDILENEKDIRPFQQPRVAITKLSDTDLELEFVFVLVPHVELCDLKKAKVKAEAPSVSEKDVDEAIERRLKDEAELVVVERKAKEGDTIVFDFEGFLPGEDGKLTPFEGGKAESFELELGSGQFVPGFEDAMIGVEPGEARDIEITFPEHYVENLAGKKAIFKTLTHEVKEKKLPELNEETVKGFGIEGVETVESLRAHEKEELLKKKLAEADNRRYAEIVEKLVENSKIDIDEDIVHSETHRYIDNLKHRVEQQGLSYEDYLKMSGNTEEKIHEEMEKQVNKDLRRLFVEGEVANQAGISVSEEELNAKLEEMGKEYRMSVEDVRRALGNNLDGFRDQLLQNKIRKHLLDTCR